MDVRRQIQSRHQLDKGDEAFGDHEKEEAMKLPKKEKPMRLEVHAYVAAGQIYKFPARDCNHAREIAGRIASEYLWVKEADGTETFFPPDKVHKVKIVRLDKKKEEKKS